MALLRAVAINLLPNNASASHAPARCFVESKTQNPSHLTGGISTVLAEKRRNYGEKTTESRALLAPVVVEKNLYHKHII
ncbi:MAG: hypothetical protein HN627_09380 [Opitutae bacterium]|nr:hypothetical protein [Opitutae bacterium]